MFMEDVYKQLKKYGSVKTNVPLARFSTFKIGGPADIMLTVTESNTLVKALSFLTGEGVDWFILGAGANVLFPDDGWRGVVIRMATEKLMVDGMILEAEAGMALSDLVVASIKHRLSGLEWAAGIPGTVGGAIRGNAGARYAYAGGEMKDSVKSVTVWRNGEVLELSNHDCFFGYRDSAFKHNHDVVLSAKFVLKPGATEESLAITQKIIAERKGKQSPSPSAGSFFKNIPLDRWKKDPALLPERFLGYKKIAAGWLIEQVGLKGFRVGDAMISEEHGNFIINAGAATQAEVIRVVEEAKQRVYTTFGVELEEEVNIVYP